MTLLNVIMDVYLKVFWCTRIQGNLYSNRVVCLIAVVMLAPTKESKIDHFFVTIFVLNHNTLSKRARKQLTNLVKYHNFESRSNERYILASSSISFIVRSFLSSSLGTFRALPFLSFSCNFFVANSSLGAHSSNLS